MKLLSFEVEDDIRLGLLLKGKIVDLNLAYHHLFNDLERFPSDMVTLLKEGEAILFEVRRLKEASLKNWRDIQKVKGLVQDVNEVKLLAPIARPRKNIVCLGLNYIDHAEETGLPVPENPIFFTKPPTSIIGPGDPIVLPKSSRQIDYEVELAFVFGREGKNVTEEEAYGYIAGYMVLNDVTARDLQRDHKQWFKGKGLDAFAPMGPFLVTREEVPDPHNLGLSTDLNGMTMQKSNTANMIFKIPTLVKVLTEDMTVEAGDIVATGTPSGVGFTRIPQVFLKDGDVLTAEVENVGLLRNKVVSG